MAAMDWGMAGSALALETLQRTLSLANRARDNLVGSALGAGLVQVLLKRLDWRSDAAADGDNQVSGITSFFHIALPCKNSLTGEAKPVLWINIRCFGSAY